MKKTILTREDCMHPVAVNNVEPHLCKIYDMEEDTAYTWTYNGKVLGPFSRRCSIGLWNLKTPPPPDDGEWECIEIQDTEGEPMCRGYVKFVSPKSKTIILYDSDVLAIMLEGGYGHAWFKELGEDGHVYSARQGLDYIVNLLETVFYAAKTEGQLVLWSKEIATAAASFLVKKELLEQSAKQLKEKL